MLTALRTPADLAALPHLLRAALRSVVNPTGHRHTARIGAAQRKTLIQRRVADAIRDGSISLELGVQILESNRAYGRDGQAALREFRTCP